MRLVFHLDDVDDSQICLSDANDWGLICGDGWSLFEAGVVCRELKLGYAQNALQTDFFGGNRSSLALSGVKCHGSEKSLMDCLHDRIGSVSCPGNANNIASVVCASGKFSVFIKNKQNK